MHRLTHIQWSRIEVLLSNKMDYFLFELFSVCVCFSLFVISFFCVLLAMERVCLLVFFCYRYIVHIITIALIMFQDNSMCVCVSVCDYLMLNRFSISLMLVHILFFFFFFSSFVMECLLFLFLGNLFVRMCVCWPFG